MVPPFGLRLVEGGLDFLEVAALLQRYFRNGMRAFQFRHDANRASARIGIVTAT
jgi:hypothetical protein